MPPVLSVSTVHSQGWNHPPGKRLEFKMLPPGFYLDMLWCLSLKWQTWDCWFDWLRSSCSQTGNMTLTQTCLEMLGHTLYYLFQQFMHVRACVYVCARVCPVKMRVLYNMWDVQVFHSQLRHLLLSQSPNTIWRPTHSILMPNSFFCCQSVRVDMVACLQHIWLSADCYWYK